MKISVPFTNIPVEPGIVSRFAPSNRGFNDILLSNFWWSNFLFANSGTDILKVPSPVASTKFSLIKSGKEFARRILLESIRLT